MSVNSAPWTTKLYDWTIDDRAPEAIGPIEDQPKDGSHKTRCPTHRKRQER